jgi:hypothetical protein
MRRMQGMAVAAALAAAFASAAGGCSMREADQAAVRLAGPTVLKTGATVVAVPGRALRVGATGGRPTIVVDGLAFDAAPGVLYELHLQRGDGKRALLGVVNFYNQGAPGYGGAPANAGRQAFDATEALRRLGGPAAALVFEPTSGVTGGPPARANPKARVRFASIRLEYR